MVALSKLEEIKDLRTVWPHEALDFTPWLSQDDNIALLADAVGLDISVDETESSVGDFNICVWQIRGCDYLGGKARKRRTQGSN